MFRNRATIHTAVVNTCKTECAELTPKLVMIIAREITPCEMERTQSEKLTSRFPLIIRR